MKLIINKDRSVIPVGTWGTVNENDYEILEFEFSAELEEYNKRIVYYLDDERVWDTIVNNKAYITNAITTKGDVKAYVWCTKENTEREADTDFRTMLFEMHFYENENADGIVPTEVQVDGFNTMLTAMNNKIAEVNALEQTIGAAEAQRQEAEATRVSNENTRQSNESTRQTNEQTRQTQEADRERRTDEAIADIEDKTAEYNQNAEEKTEAFNTNASQKTNEFNSNYTQKVNDFNANATTQKTEFNTNASSKTSAFNENATSKTNTFNSNANDKTSAFNDNATQKTTNFDNNASEKTDEFNTNAQEKIDEYDEHIVEYQAQIDELQEEVEELSENMPWNTTEQATEIIVDDAAKYSKNRLELFGNTEQIQYTGKNLLPYPYTESSKTTKGITFTDLGNGSIMINGTATGNALFYLLGTSQFGHIQVPIPGNYIYCENSTNDINVRIFHFENGHYHNLGQSTGQSSKINLDTYSTGFIELRVTSGVTVDNLVIKPMITMNEDNDYEPYVGGVPSPSPEFPQPIHVVTGENTIHINNTDYPLSLGNIELCKIGDYQDYLYKENGNWYKYEAIKKYIINENTELYVSNSKNDSAFSFHIGNQTSLTTNNDFLRSNFYPNKVAFSTYACINIYNGDVWFINPYDSNFTPEMTQTEAEAKFHELYDNKLYYYTVKQSNPTQITDETLIAQLDEIYEHLQLVKGTNNISITASDLAPYMKLSYMQDLKSKLDNLDSRLALLE